MTASNGERTIYDYTGNLLREVRTESASGTVTGTRVRYAYDSEQRLAKVTVDLSPADNSVADGKVYVTEYSYHGASKRVAGIVQDDGSKLAIEYVQVGSAFLVSSITDALGAVTRFTYVPAAAGQPARTMVQDALGQATIYEVDAEGRLSQAISPGGLRTHAFTYDAQGNVKTATDGAGATSTFTYDVRGNRTLEQHADGSVVRRTFNARNLLLTETVEGPVPLTTRYIYDASEKLLLFTVSGEGRVTGHVYEDGRRVTSVVYGAGCLPATPSRSRCSGHGQPRTSPPRCRSPRWPTTRAVSSPRAPSTVRSKPSCTTRPDDCCNTWQPEGRSRGTRTTARAACSPPPTPSTTRRQPCTTTPAPRPRSGWRTGWSPPGLRPGGAAGGGDEFSRHQRAGNDALHVRRCRPPAHDRRPRGSPHWMLYDTSGRKVADVDGNGTLTEYAYNAAGLLSRQRTYAAAATTSLLVDANGALRETTLELLRPQSSNADAREWRTYDDVGRLVGQAFAIGAGTTASVTKMAYDTAGRLVATTAYATSIAAPADADASFSTPVPSSDDRVTRYFHDADGLRIGMLDAEGYLSLTSYNAAGTAVEEVTHARAVDAALRAAAPLAAMTPVARSAADARILTFYDGRGRTVARVDAESHLTRMVYDAAGNVRQTVQYAVKVAATVTAQTPIEAARPERTTASDRTTDRTYDALGRLLSETSPEGLKTTYAYDAAGHLVTTDRAASAADRRSLLARYDVLGRLTGELAGEGAALLTGVADAAAIDAIWASHGITHAYDAASRRISSVDQLGRKTLFFYDEDGALTHTVDARGGVRERRYDARGRLVLEVAYASTIAVAGRPAGPIAPCCSR
ncbi:RHS repeat protein [Ramlibacter terrae]|uniref:RHS repeat protein n=1 Tax=Ramlibacter terrae TaxID=2732511 RepID=A0ABX6P2U2_9BURK|nr:RHS repeat protein [Ramlibacter terrae]